MDNPGCKSRRYCGTRISGYRDPTITKRCASSAGSSCDGSGSSTNPLVRARTRYRSFEGKLVNDLWTYDLTDNEWSFQKYDEGPSARSHHAMAISRQSHFVVFGGEFKTPFPDQLSDDIWVLDADSVAWSQMPSQWQLLVERRRPHLHRATDCFASNSCR